MASQPILLTNCMHLYVAVTDNEWFRLHASKETVEEVNFWRPLSEANFKALAPGELLLFKLHSPENYIAGGGFFTRFVRLPVNLAWDTFGEANGVRTLIEMRDRIARYRHRLFAPGENPEIGCILLGEPFFWEAANWIPIPPDFKLNTVQGKGYSAETGYGVALWESVKERLAVSQGAEFENQIAARAVISAQGYGEPQIVLPRLGQGLFRTLVTDLYGRRCAITGERTLPVLDAVHIKPFSLVQQHEVPNGLLLRSDLHRLFDEGYLTVDPVDRRVVVSKRIKEEFDNGKEYYRLEGMTLRAPVEPWAAPSAENLEYHAYNVFR